MDHFEKFENQLLSSYESTLAVEAEEICKEVDSLLSDDIDLIREKVNVYCLRCTSFKKDVIDTKLYERCKKYLDDMRNYRDIIYTLENISRTRKMV